MPRELAITTAYSRASADPLILTLDGRKLRVDPALDVGRAATLFAKFQDGLTQGMVVIADDNAPLEDRMRVLDEKKEEGLTALSLCLIEEDRAAYADVRPHLGIVELSNVISWLLGELSTLDPTQQGSSSDGSPPTGTTSTDGAVPEGSTPSPSPSIEPSTSTST